MLSRFSPRETGAGSVLQTGAQVLQLSCGRLSAPATVLSDCLWRRYLSTCNCAEAVVQCSLAGCLAVPTVLACVMLLGQPHCHVFGFSLTDLTNPKFHSVCSMCAPSH